MKKIQRDKTYLVNKSSDQTKKGGLKDTIMAAVHGMLPDSGESKFPLSLDSQKNLNAQLELIAFFAEKYEAKPHNKKWFLDRFDLNNEGLSNLYDHYQQNRTALKNAGAPLFSVYLFEQLQKEAQGLSAPLDNKESEQTLQDVLAVHFHAARYHAHSKALWNNIGTMAKQRDHVKAAADSFEKAVAKIPGEERRRELKEKCSLIGFPGAKFDSFTPLKEHKNQLLGYRPTFHP